jgi:hypothetical protein
MIGGGVTARIKAELLISESGGVKGREHQGGCEPGQYG